MRKKVILVLLLSLTTSRAYAQAFVAASQNGVTASTAVTCTQTTTAGHGLVIFTTEAVNNTSTVTISDTASQSWTQTASGYVSQGTAERSAMWFIPNSASVTSVTATWSGSLSTRVDCILFELSGMVSSSIEDSSVNNSQASGTTATSGSLTTTNAKDILIFGVRINGTYSNPTAGSGYTIPTNGSSARAAMQYKVVSTTQSAVTTTLTWTTSQINANIFAGFKAPATGGGANKRQKLEQIDP